MKKYNYFFFITLISLFLSCTSSSKADGKSSKRSSSGKTLEVLIVIEEKDYKGEIKAIIDSLFRQDQKLLNQPEALFDIATLPPSSLYNTEMFRSHRNIIIINKDSENLNKVYVSKDKWASPQMVVEFSVTDNVTLMNLLTQYFETLKKMVYATEHTRIKRAFKRIEDKSITNHLKEDFGFWLTIPTEFTLSLSKKDFAWIRKETRKFSIGVFIHTFPYTDTSVFNLEHIINLRNKISKQYIKGPSEGSYMVVENRRSPVSERIHLQGNFAVETRGLWHLDGDFMGGPFVNYMLLDPEKKQVIMLDGYVYNPNNSKRDLLMQAEAICRSIEFVKKEEVSSDQKK